MKPGRRPDRSFLAWAATCDNRWTRQRQERRRRMSLSTWYPGAESRV